MTEHLIPVARFRPIVEAWIAEFETAEVAYTQLANASQITAGAWRKRLCETPPQGWFVPIELDAADVDEFFTAAGLTHVWHVDLQDLARTTAEACEDCGGDVEAGVMPLGLMRRDPTAPPGFRRKAGGRRWRDWTLCRRCRAEALRQRALNGAAKRDGRKRYIRTKERIELKKGGRPRLLTDQQLRAAHVVYDQAGLSMREVVERLQAAGVAGSYGGLAFALHDGWRRLSLPVRPRGVAMAMARFGTDGTKTKPQLHRCVGRLTRRKGRCTGWARKGMATCWNHRDQEPSAEIAA